MPVTSYARGHVIYFNTKDDAWKLLDTDEFLKDVINTLPCKNCGKLPSKAGYDNCIGYVDRYSSICCGHGVEKPYAVLNNGIRIQFQTKEEMVNHFNKNQQSQQS